MAETARDVSLYRAVLAAKKGDRPNRSPSLQGEEFHSPGLPRPGSAQAFPRAMSPRRARNMSTGVNIGPMPGRC